MHLFAKLYFIAKKDDWIILKYHVFSRFFFFPKVFLKNNAANDKLENSPREAHGRISLPFRSLNKIIYFVSYDYDPP